MRISERRSLKDRFDDRLRGIPAGALHGLLRRLSAIEAFRGRWESAPKPGARVLRRVRESVASRSAAASCRIAGESRPGAASGVADALRAVFDGHASMPPTEDRLLALHAAMFRHLPDERARAGRYKSAGLRERGDRDFLSEPVALRSPGPLLIPAQMETLAGWLPSRLAGGEFHPLLVVAAYLLEFLAIRPFADGNGTGGPPSDEPSAPPLRSRVSAVRLPRRGDPRPQGGVLPRAPPKPGEPEPAASRHLAVAVRLSRRAGGDAAAARRTRSSRGSPARKRCRRTRPP